MTTRALVYCRDGKPLPKTLRDCIDRRVTLVSTPPHHWATTDFYVVPTQLSARVERVAARLGALPVVMPQGSNWLNEKLLASPRPLALFWAWRLGAAPGDKL